MKKFYKNYDSIRKKQHENRGYAKKGREGEGSICLKT